MSTPQNPYSGSDAENNQNIPSDQARPDTGQASPEFSQPQDPAAGEHPVDETSVNEPSVGEPTVSEPTIGEPAVDGQSDATQAHAGTAQYGQGSQFSQAGQYGGQQNQFDQQNQFGQPDQFGQGGQYSPPEQYGQGSQGGQYNPQAQYGQYGQPAQQDQYYQGADYAAHNQTNYAGSQHAPAGGFPPPAAQHNAGGNSGFFKSLFDFRFDSFIAVRWAGFIYIIAIVVAALSWLASIIGGLITGAAAGAATSYMSSGPSFSPWPLLLAIIFGWVVPALWVIFVRLALELIVANVKTAENTKKIADSIGR